MGEVQFIALLPEKKEAYNLILDKLKPFTKEEEHLAESLLIQNIQANNIDGIASLLGKGADLDHEKKYGVRPLHFACKESDISTVDFFLDKGEDVNLLDKEGKSPLFYAAARKNIDVMEHLLERGADITIRDKEGITPLDYAIEASNREIVTALCARGLRLDVENGANMFPLHYGVKSNNKEFIEFLLDAGAPVDSASSKTGETPLHIASGTGAVDVVQFLIERGAKVDAHDAANQNMLHGLAKSGKHESFVQIIETIDPKIATKLLVSKDSNGQKPIDIMVENSNLNDENAKKELKKIAKHIGGILRDRGIVTEKTTWQSLADSFQSLCKAIGIKTEREKVRESIMMSEERDANDYANQLKNALKKTMDRLPAPTTGPVMRPRAREDTGRSM